MIALLSALAFGLASPPPDPSAFLPDEDGVLGVVGTHSSKSLKAGALVFGQSGRFMQEGLTLLNGGNARIGGQDKSLDDALVAASRVFLTLGLGYGFDASLGLPLYYEKIPGVPDRSETFAAGDASLLLKAGLPGSLPFTSLSLFAQASAPTSSDDGVLPKELAYVPSDGGYPGRTSRALGLKVPQAGLGAGATVDLSELADGTETLIHANVLGTRAIAGDARNPLGTLRVSLAAEISPVRSLRLEAEIRYESLVADPTDLVDPLGQTTTLGLGVGWAPGRRFSLRMGALLAPPPWNPAMPLSLPSASGKDMLFYRLYPTVSIYFGIAWQGFPIDRDTDHDGIPDSRDNCPTVPEDVDGFQDEDGCPDPDNDGDGIPDELDNCPYAAEDFDGFEDKDGCPDPDNDKDGIPDVADKCPNDPEDKDGFQDEDGCPDPDNDKDGICDPWVAEQGLSAKYADVCHGSDKCPNVPENINGIEDADGCPENDADGDGIPDSRDKCPNEKEIFNFYQDEDGCPDERPEPVSDGILAGIVFQPGSPDLRTASDSVLKALAVRLQAYPGTEIEIQAHLDSQAGPGAKELTQARAEAVADALNKYGVEIRRMKPVGYGSSRPVASNRTAKGREANRRIEIRRLN